MVQVRCFLRRQRREAPRTLRVDHHDHCSIRQCDGAAILTISVSAQLEMDIAVCPEQVVQRNNLGCGFR
eukprot:880946-Rhodomonas_salina.2